MIYRGPGFLAFVWFGFPQPLPLPAASCLSFSVFLCIARRAYWQENGEGGSGGAKSYDGEKAWPSLNHLILSALSCGQLLPAHVMTVWGDKAPCFYHVMNEMDRNTICVSLSFSIGRYMFIQGGFHTIGADIRAIFFSDELSAATERRILQRIHNKTMLHTSTNVPYNNLVSRGLENKRWK
jgi:hypothetical protein